VQLALCCTLNYPVILLACCTMYFLSAISVPVDCHVSYEAKGALLLLPLLMMSISATAAADKDATGACHGDEHGYILICQPGQEGQQTRVVLQGAAVGSHMLRLTAATGASGIRFILGVIDAGNMELMQLILQVTHSPCQGNVAGGGIIVSACIACALARWDCGAHTPTHHLHALRTCHCCAGDKRKQIPSIQLAVCMLMFLSGVTVPKFKNSAWLGSSGCKIA
jgi:hypothetical protein